MTTMLRLIVLGAIAAFIAGCSFTLSMKLVPEPEQSTTETSSVQAGAHET